MTTRRKLLRHISWLLLLAMIAGIPTAASSHDGQSKPDRGPKDTGAVLVFAGTGWYRHPGDSRHQWLARPTGRRARDAGGCHRNTA